jgi:phosphoribosyl 1,2-cyclic phosphodiesterase
MTIKFWGCRGSIPTPLTPSVLKAKISSIIQRIQPKDIRSPEDRERFMANLPSELFSTVGGNTTSFEVRSDNDDLFIVDGGTGIRELGKTLTQPGEVGLDLHIFLTHFHWDHLQGLPFFAPFFNPKNKITFYSPVKDFKKHIIEQMAQPYFPVPFSIFPAQTEFVELSSGPLQIGETMISWKAVNHPGGCFSYRFEENNKVVIFSTDTELTTKDFEKTPIQLAFYEGADTLILDAQYTLGEAVEKFNWGHTSYSLAVDFALEYKISQLFLFHHEPNYDDYKLEEILRAARWYHCHSGGTDLDVQLAREGEEFVI